MFSEILKVIPKIDGAALATMEKNLNSRFGKVAKKFGTGIMNVFKGGGVLGVALALIDKLLNPIKELQEAIDRTLANASDIADNANQFQTTTGKLFNLQQLAKSKGLEADSLYTLMSKFQTSVAEAQADPNKNSAVREYTGFTDMADGFFEFIQALQKMERSQQILVQQEVFGEKQIMKMAGFLGTDFAQQKKLIGAKDSAYYTKRLDKLDAVGDLADVLTAKRNLGDIDPKSRLITADIIKQRAAADQVQLDRENLRLASYSDLAAISLTVDKMMAMIDERLALLGKGINLVITAINKIVSFLEPLTKSRAVKGIMGIFGKGE